jgi:hypothetical protein
MALEDEVKKVSQNKRTQEQRHYNRGTDIFLVLYKTLHAPYPNNDTDVVFNARNSNCLHGLPLTTGFASS